MPSCGGGASRTGAVGVRQPVGVEPGGEVGGRLAGEDRRQPHRVGRLRVRRVREHAVAAILDRHGGAEPLGERVRELLHRPQTLQMSNAGATRVRCRPRLRGVPFAAWTTPRWSASCTRSASGCGRRSRRPPATRSRPPTRRRWSSPRRTPSSRPRCSASSTSCPPAARSTTSPATSPASCGEVEETPRADRRRDAHGQHARRPHRDRRRRGRGRQAHGAPLHRRREPAGGARHAARPVEGRRGELRRPARRGDGHPGRGPALRRALRRGAADASPGRPRSGRSARRSSATAPARCRARTSP